MIAQQESSGAIHVYQLDENQKWIDRGAVHPFQGLRVDVSRIARSVQLDVGTAGVGKLPDVAAWLGRHAHFAETVGLLAYV